jgi:hypothetical protein
MRNSFDITAARAEALLAVRRRGEEGTSFSSTEVNTALN